MKNVILVTIDSLRADHVSCLGYHVKTTPNIDKLAKKGILFTNAISCGPDTPTSIGPLMTSSYVLTYYASSGDLDKLKTTVDEFERMKSVVLEIFKYEKTISGVLRKNGYVTSMFHSNPYLSRYYNFGRDFDYFYDSFSQVNLKEYSLKRRITKIVEHNRILYDFAFFVYKNIYYKILKKKIEETPYERASSINNKAVSWLKSINKKFFAWIHYMDIHFPYVPLEEFKMDKNIDSSEIVDLNYKMQKNSKMDEGKIKKLIKLYDSEIRYVDNEVKSLIDQLDDAGKLEDTVIIITADHGEEFRDHGDFAHHHAKLYEELIRVPVIIYNSEFEGIEVDDVVSLLDLAPTILDLLDIKIPKCFQGESLISAIRKEMDREGVITESFIRGKRNVSYRTNEWKLIVDNFRKRKELYNLKKDPEERNNLFNEEKEIAENFDKIIKNHIYGQLRRMQNLKKKILKSKIRKIAYSKRI